MSAASKSVCLVVGAGDATGAAIARAFAREGLVACLVRRPRHAAALEALAERIREDGGDACAFPADARDEDDMIALFDRIETEIGPIEVAVFNIGANVHFSVTETTARVYRKVWEMGAYAGFLTGREAAKRMRPRARGTIIFTGATASLRGGAGFSAFAGAKQALRALAQSMARELGPHNIHVAHVVIDGAIDTEFIRGIIPDVDAKRAEDAILSPDAIAENYVMLHRQPRSAWTHELDLRPWKEKW
ncbi:MAG TPA: SDR family oxidoreductase [Parvularculaceae bacterium]|nr:SDR family oxidoreductase [Parvularculaceae bacterium]HNS85939.1 SDR family oxidoreductase [Parvularculaceae bacterium]